VCAEKAACATGAGGRELERDLAAEERKWRERNWQILDWWGSPIGRHLACGTVARMPTGHRRWCEVCGPPPRTFAARAREPSHLYLIAFTGPRRFVKVGIGLRGRIQEHKRNGGLVLQVLAARHDPCQKAERRILREHRADLVDVVEPHPLAGSHECLRWSVGRELDLADHLRGRDVTARFRACR